MLNKAKLESCVPQDRKDFIAAVTACSELLVRSEKAGTLEVAIAHTRLDVTIIASQACPAKGSRRAISSATKRVLKDFDTGKIFCRCRRASHCSVPLFSICAIKTP